MPKHTSITTIPAYIARTQLGSLLKQVVQRKARGAEPLELGVNLGPELWAKKASSGRARSQMKRLVAPAKARKPCLVGIGMLGLTV